MGKIVTFLVLGVFLLLLGIGSDAQAQVVIDPKDPVPPDPEVVDTFMDRGLLKNLSKNKNDSVPIEIVALQLVSVNPITVVMPINQKACRINGIGNIIVLPDDFVLPEFLPVITILAEPDDPELEELIQLELDSVGVLPPHCANKKKPFLLPLEDVFSIGGRGTVGSGRTGRR